MKYIYKISLLFLAMVITVGCENEDDYVPPFNDVSSLTFWTSPNGTSLETEKIIQVDRFIAFQDLSRGVVSHEWRIQEGAKFLTAQLYETDTIYANYVRPNVGLTTTDALANVLFTELGTTEVHLINTFRDSVRNSVKEGDIWKVDQIFTIEVVE